MERSTIFQNGKHHLFRLGPSKNHGELLVITRLGTVNLHFPMVFLWFSHGFPMVFLWFSHGFPMVFPWFKCWWGIPWHHPLLPGTTPEVRTMFWCCAASATSAEIPRLHHSPAMVHGGNTGSTLESPSGKRNNYKWFDYPGMITLW